MRTVEVKVYKFAELSPKARDNARIALDQGFTSEDEAKNSITALAEHFSGRVTDWSIDWTGCERSRMEFSMPDDLSTAEIRRRLKELPKGECKLTGWCWDESCTDGFRAALRGGERDLTRLMEAAFAALLKDCVAEYESRQTDEYLTEHCEAQEIEFWDDGSVFRE